MDGMTTTTGGVLKWLTSAKSADAVAVIRAKLENTELIVGDSPKVHAKEPRPMKASSKSSRRA